MPSTRKTWIFVSSFFAIILVVAAWLLILSPVRQETSTVKDDAEQVESANQILNTRVTKLRAQFAEIDTYRAELTEYQKQIPSVVDYESIVAEIERASDETKVPVLEIASDSSIVPVTPYTAIKVEKPELDEDGNEIKSTKPSEPVTVSGAAPTLTGALSEEIPGFYQVPLRLTVQGSYDRILKFSESLQIDSTRALLVPAVAVTALDETPESDSAPAAKKGDLTYVLDVLAYVVEYDRTVLPASDEELEVTPLPPAAKDNVFSPSR
jgi:Tfp pilus assembly protein PilO